MIKNRAFTILELLVVLAVIGVFSAIAYPNVSGWIADRNVKNAAFETVAFVKDRKLLSKHDTNFIEDIDTFQKSKNSNQRLRS